LVAESIVFHINANEVIQSRCWETEDARDLLRVEEVRSLVPVNPHSSKIVTKKVVERITRDEAQAVRYPICFVRDIMIVRLCLSSKFTDSIGTPLICSRPYAECNAVEGVLRILLQDERMVQTLGLTSSRDKLDIMWKASLKQGQQILAMLLECGENAKKSG
jgi:hypothetical protein